MVLRITWQAHLHVQLVGCMQFLRFSPDLALVLAIVLLMFVSSLPEQICLAYRPQLLVEVQVLVP